LNLVAEATFDLQPIFRLADRKLVGYEALARWAGRRTEAVLEEARIEGTIIGLDRELGRRAITEVLPRIPEDMYLSVNVTPETLASHERTDPFVYGIPYDQRVKLVVEITEQSRAEMFAMYDALVHLRSLGIRYAVDDVGSAFGNPFLVGQLLPDFIKLDRSLVSRLGDYIVNRANLHGLVVTAQDLNIPVIAEGIETREDLGWVRHMGVKYGQGFYLGRPAPVDEVLGGDSA
jgi:EAL domain-containing protein (putative c-di-GMP-specific phosphodiesterase class I)